MKLRQVNFKDMSKVTLDILATELKNLTSEVRVGFKGVHERQDKTNGTLKEHDECIVDLEKEDIQIKAKLRQANDKAKNSKMLWITVTTLIAIILALMGKYVY